MTEQQLRSMRELASQVKGQFEQLPLTDVLNRIHVITDRDFAKCIAGLRMMLAEKLITAAFIPDLAKLDEVARMTDVAMPIFESTDALIVKPGTFENLGKVITVQEAQPKDGPTDDDDEPGDARPAAAWLSHIDANF